MHNGGVGFLFGRQPFDRGQIALKISTRNAESGFEIAVLSDAPIKLSAGTISDQSAPICSHNSARVLATVTEATRHILIEIFASSALS